MCLRPFSLGSVNMPFSNIRIARHEWMPLFDKQENWKLPTFLVVKQRAEKLLIFQPLPVGETTFSAFFPVSLDWLTLALLYFGSTVCVYTQYKLWCNTWLHTYAGSFRESLTLSQILLASTQFPDASGQTSKSAQRKASWVFLKQHTHAQGNYYWLGLTYNLKCQRKVSLVHVSVACLWLKLRCFSIFSTLTFELQMHRIIPSKTECWFWVELSAISVVYVQKNLSMVSHPQWGKPILLFFQPHVSGLCCLWCLFSAHLCQFSVFVPLLLRWSCLAG